MFYTLPKIWQGRIKKYWDRTIPGDFPASKSKFDLKFDTQDEIDAVNKFEEELGTEESVVNEFMPEGNFLSGYLGIYDVNGPKNEKVLLNPEKVTTNDPFIVLHYENEEWKQIEDVELIEGYIWGVVPSDEDEDGFSPIAVVFYKKDMEIATLDWFNGDLLVANGNPVRITMTNNNQIIATNTSNGKEINLSEKNIKSVVGGTVDGSDVDTTNVSVVGANAETFRFYAGSMYYSDAEDAKSAKVNNANITFIDSRAMIITAGVGMVRTENYNATLNNSYAYALASGQATISKLGKDVNGSLDVTLASAQWTKNANIVINDSEVVWGYTGGNTGYTYTVNANLVATNANITGGFTCGGSNGRSDNVNVVFDNVVATSYISVNRGITDKVNTKIKDSTIDLIAVYSDIDDQATGGVNSVSLDIDKGTYKSIIVGKNYDKLATDANNVNYVKISRSADYAISDNDLGILGDKFIVK